MGKKEAPKPNIGRVAINFKELFQRLILLYSKIFIKFALLNLFINWIGTRENIKSVMPSNKGKYNPKSNKLRNRKIKEDIIKMLLIPNIMGMEINTPINAFLDVVKIMVWLVIIKNKIDISFLYLFFLFK